MIENENITVIVHGPVQNYQDRIHHEEGITERCLNSVRQHLPGSTIILSTWINQDLTRLDYDVLIEEQDVGPNKDTVVPKNYNRQMHLLNKGLRETITPYALKLRSDNYLTGDQFKTLQQRFASTNRPTPILDERIVINANLSRRTSKGFKVIYSLSDFFYFGRTDDLIKIWGNPSFRHNPLSPFISQKANDETGYPCLEAEQIYGHLWISKLLDMPIMKHRFDASKAQIKQWEIFLANNIVIAEPNNIGLGLRKISIRKKRVNEYSFVDWQKLYRLYCDPKSPVPLNLNYVILQLRRSIHLPFSKLWTIIKYHIIR
ncbi:WavE lipopolysaccharide synthesis family protein [Photobacterium leiognathi]|uniref:WavE lipopolysaccharide synthesis family protein n=1 Tax=Photobacterium leiognathi TaxID=553611 RepID=UPI002980DD54|nr:WavE lipopolysaccharide synthesis family protein [Photobacterium leiognathi]